MLAAGIGVILLVLLAAAVARYSIFRAALDRYDHIGVYIFFLVVGLPVVAVGLLLIAHYVVGPTS
jgi:uncharacterized membrane protein YdbT with pleckstrin-like domain